MLGVLLRRSLCVIGNLMTVSARSFYWTDAGPQVNSEADRLADGDTRGFDPQLRVHADIRQLRWLVLNWLMEAGSAFHRQSARHSKKDSRGLVRKQATHYARRKKALKERESLGDGAGTPGAWGFAMAGGPCSGFSRVPDDRAVLPHRLMRLRGENDSSPLLALLRGTSLYYLR